MYRLCLLVLVGVWHASAQLTTPAPGTAVDCNVVGIQNCGKCDLPGLTCAYCADNYVLAPDYKSCIPCDVNCIDCVLDSTGKVGVCQECALGYEVRSDGTCGACGTYCATCKFTDSAQTLTSCLACFPAPAGWPAYLLGAYSQQCQDCTQVTTGCSSCSEAADKTLTCTGCQQGFIAVSSAGSKTCTACPSNCLSCSLAKGATTPTTCATCVTGYVANSATNPTYACLYCDSTICSKCSSTASASYPNIAQCTTCQKGYYLDSNNLCQSCPSGCATCTSATVCQSCEAIGFWFDSTNTKCTPCSYGCSTCTFTAGVESCTACIAGYGLQSGGSSCQECPLNCYDCSDPATCTSCVAVAAGAAAYELVADVDGTFCYLCPANCATCADGGNGDTTCTSCDTGYQAGTDINGYSFCYACPSHCSACTVDPITYQTTCTTCMPDANGNDYYLNANSACVSCAAQCTDCFTNSDNTCNACQPGYLLVTTGTKPVCNKCTTANCQTCGPTVSTCTACNDGYYLDGSSLCQPCTKNCICSAAATPCFDCLPTLLASTAPLYSYDGSAACVQCDAKCTACSSGSCTACISGYVPDGNGVKCVACDPNCDLTVAGSCTYVGTATQCSACVAGYFLNNKNGCTKCPTVGCSACGTGPIAAATACTDCLPAYVSNGASPVLCLANPTGCDTGTLSTDGKSAWCSVCSAGYVLNSVTNLCDPCPADCTSCTADAKGVLSCDTCDVGFALNIFTCSACPEGCTACKNVGGEMFCTQCSPQGYYLDAKNGVCIACTLCTSCSASGCNAGTCFEGYGLASDRSCTDCSTLTTVSGCSNCTDADSTGMAMCLDCGLGQVLDGWGANCVDYSPLTDCEMPEYRPYECASGSCNSPFEWVTDGPGRGQCGLHCAVCGDLSRGLFLAECQNANNNYTEELVVGACWVGRTVDSAGNVLYARGGFDKFNCTSDNQWEFVDPSNSATTYKCCQTADGCSDSIVLDGVAGASAISFSLALLFASILAAFRLF